MSGKIKEGDTAPDFTLGAQDGRAVSLHDYRGSRNVIVYFYPKDFTRGCTTETRTFGLNYDQVKNLDAEVIGISSDPADIHSRFASECGVKFPLLSDRDGKVRTLYGVKSSFGIIPGRVTFVIDKQGVVRSVFSSQINPKWHVSKALEVLSGLPK
jgi:peroxiredoxin Q/BCP